ncbi:hypothetical protein G6L28_03535 [Agrobacterium larrymoorei]|uniref:beta family protein n=1 Tax=Agrobacterium larrymoorei TaxID=160699 RepID=UPI001572F2BE|nr:hypothetical protein [Agrobacterium larrymoorei]NTJ41672.1 hypothetical protein [Agrobacterium larrymoorei]
MAVDISNLNYVPTLAVRSSEMNGLERLPAASKDRLQPTFLLAPWPNATELMRTVDRVQRAFPSRPFFLDIDRDYEITNMDAAAQQHWLELQDPANSYANWIGFVEGVTTASPCLQIAGLTHASIAEQIGAFQEMGRTFALRIELQRFPPNLSQAITAINEIGSADYAVILDAGWIHDTQPTRLRIANLISNQLSGIDAEIPLVVSYTTIPKGFAEVEGAEFEAFDNRQCISELVQLTNRQRIIYGDWGSTRPRERGIASRPKPRIDLALRDGWLSARNKPEDWDYDDAANQVLSNPRWQEVDGLGVWGEFMIRQTAISPNLGINSPQKNVAARVNLHLHTQAFYNDGDIRGINLDEQWED